MMFAPQQAGFAWPAQTQVSAPSGATITIRPYAANFAGIDAAGRRSGENHRYYATSYGIHTELEIKAWVAGGQAESFDLLGTYNALFDAAGVERLPFAQVVRDLRERGFADGTILVNLSWLVQDGYAAIDVGGGAPIIRKLRR